jgi:phosphatidylserine decarboxylase
MVMDGFYYALGFAAGGAVVGYLVGFPYALPFYVLAVFCLYFFRDPDREIPEGRIAVSPADGKVVSIKGETSSTTRVSIFLNIFDVHVNRAPVSGAIAQVRYQKGKFHVASRESASIENEQNTVTLKQDDGTQVVFAQIAGLIARRIVFSKKTGDSVKMGERVGLIKFGSRVDVYFGPEWDIAVQPGQRVSAGSSILARKRQSDAVA